MYSGDGGSAKLVIIQFTIQGNEANLIKERIYGWKKDVDITAGAYQENQR